MKRLSCENKVQIDQPESRGSRCFFGSYQAGYCAFPASHRKRNTAQSDICIVKSILGSAAASCGPDTADAVYSVVNARCVRQRSVLFTTKKPLREPVRRQLAAVSPPTHAWHTVRPQHTTALQSSVHSAVTEVAMNGGSHSRSSDARPASIPEITHHFAPSSDRRLFAGLRE